MAFTRYLYVAIIFFSAGLYKSAFFIFSFVKLVFHLSVIFCSLPVSSSIFVNVITLCNHCFCRCQVI